MVFTKKLFENLIKRKKSLEELKNERDNLLKKIPKKYNKIITELFLNEIAMLEHVSDMKDIEKKSTSFFASDEEKMKGLNSIKPNLNFFSELCDIKKK